jgi:ABC-type glycerol-3-phosphate transport system substrate-binding protein
MNSRTISRRDFLKLVGAATGGMLLAACSGGSGGNQARIMVDSWALAYAPFKEMAKKYNELHPEAQIKVEASPGGWMTKVIGQIRSNKLQWSAAGVMSTYHDLAAWVQLDMIQPLDAYITASTEPGATTFLSDMLPTIKDDETYEGKMYGIPFSIENIAYEWNSEWFGKAGINQAPKTWQELVDSSTTVKQYLSSQGNTDTYALGFDLGHLNRNLGALFFSISDEPYTPEGLYDWESDEMRQSLQLMRQLSRAGLTPPNCGEGVEMYDLWTRGRIASLYSCSSRGVWAQKTLGFDKVSTSPLPTFDGEPHSGTVFWGNSVSILNQAPMPQAAIDFLIFATGPQNADWQKAIIEAGTSPAFDSVYTNMIEGDPALEKYRWMSDVRDQVAISVPSPKNYFYQIQNEAWSQHRAEYLKDDSTMTEDELVQKVLTSIDEIHQQVLESVPTPIP